MITIKLDAEEYENFRTVAEKYNVKFDVRLTRDNMYSVTAPRDKLFEWGYLEAED
jgi:hypothetical protein